MVRALSLGALALLATLLLGSAAAPAFARCVGDCGGDGEVTINELILGVNIALGEFPVSACPAFANGEGEVTIAQLITGVNNALEGCPVQPPTPTVTHTLTATATATTVPATPTRTAIPTGTATATVTATATGMPTGTATATASATAPGVPTGTATATATASPTATAIPTGTTSATAPPTPTPTATAVPPGPQLAGRAAFISAGLGSLQSLVAAVVTAATNDGGAMISGAQGLAPPIESDDCPISGNTTQSCTEMGSEVTKVIHLALGADNCVVSGPLGGTSEFEAAISIDSTPNPLNDCNGPIFFAGRYDVADLTVVRRDAANHIALTTTAELTGDLNVAGGGGQCLVSALSLTVTGTVSAMLPDGSGVQVQFLNTTVTMTDIRFSEDCVPLQYSLKFNGGVIFTPLQEALLEVSAPLINGDPIDDASFDVTFTDFILIQDATTSPITVTMDGTMASTCFGGQLVLDTLTPLAVAAGQLCPNAGEVAVTGSGGSMATVTYDDDGVMVTPAGGPPISYPSCLAAELLMCAPV